MRYILASTALCLLAVLAGCGSATTPYASCCYEGRARIARLGELPVTLRDGRQLEFRQVFPGFAPGRGIFTRSLPFEEVLAEDVIYQSLTPLLPLYDANNDGRLEQPEIVVLYAREAALGSGVPVRHLGAPPGVWALETANADIGALVRWVEAHRANMTPAAQQIFTDLERLGLDLRTRGGEAGPHKENTRFLN